MACAAVPHLQRRGNVAHSTPAFERHVSDAHDSVPTKHSLHREAS